MKIILTKDVDSLGLAGQVVNVANGYARNMLIPGQNGRSGHAAESQIA